MFLSFWIAAVVLSEIWNKPYNTSSPNLISENVDVCLFVAKYINPISQCVYMFVCRYCDVILYLRNIYIFANITAYDSTFLLESVVCRAVPDVKFHILQKAEPDLTWPMVSMLIIVPAGTGGSVNCYRVCKWIIHPISTYFVLQTEKWYNSALQFTRTTRRDVMSCTATIKDFSMKRPRKFCRHALDEFQNESGTKLSPELESDL